MRRKRITITLKEDVIRKLDEYIDGEHIRNRSHAIESLLYQLLKENKISVAYILAFDNKWNDSNRSPIKNTPKPLLKVKDKTLLEYNLKQLKEFGIKDVIIGIGYLKEKIKNYFGDGSKFGLNISYVEGTDKTGTGEGLLKIKSKPTNDFLVLNGDVLTNMDLDDFLLFHKESKGIASVAVTTKKNVSNLGNLKIKGNKILEFSEKPELGKENSYFINAGYYVFKPEIFKYIPKGRAMLEYDVFPKLAKEGKIFAYSNEAPWYHIQDNSTYNKINK